MKSHCEYAEANNTQDLYSIMGNTLADEITKIINKQDIPVFRDAADAIKTHSARQIADLGLVLCYLCDLNSLHSTLRLEKDRELQNEGDAAHNVDEISHIQKHLTQWRFEGPTWQFTDPLQPVIAYACPTSVQIAYCVWHFFQTLIWRHPDLHIEKTDYGVT